MGPKVVITGIGPVTPVGTGVEDFWTGLTSGRSAKSETISNIRLAASSDVTWPGPS